MFKTICFTGPRPKNLHGYNETEQRRYSEIVWQTQCQLERFAADGTTRFISGGAQGFDQLAFWAVNHLRKTRPEIENIVYVPFQNQPSVWKAQGMFSQQEYQLMLNKATGTRIISENPADSRAAAQALFRRNHAMVADSDLVVELLSDRSLDYRTAVGGTAECVRYALSQGKPVFAIKYLPGTAQPFSADFL